MRREIVTRRLIAGALLVMFLGACAEFFHRCSADTPSARTGGGHQYLVAGPLANSGDWPTAHFHADGIAGGGNANAL